MTKQKDIFEKDIKDDSELSTPEHDKLVLGLLDKSYLFDLILDIKNYSMNILGNIYTNSDEISNSINISLEVPIRPNYNILGYWDVVIGYKIPCIPENICREYHTSKNISNECLFKKIDCSNSCEHFRLYSRAEKRYSYLDTYKPIYIEVKPKIYSFGNTIRQLQKYVEYSKINANQVYLYTPDTTFKSAFESQGFKVITPLK